MYAYNKMLNLQRMQDIRFQTSKNAVRAECYKSHTDVAEQKDEHIIQRAHTAGEIRSGTTKNLVSFLNVSVQLIAKTLMECEKNKSLRQLVLYEFLHIIFLIIIRLSRTHTSISPKTGHIMS